MLKEIPILPTYDPQLELKQLDEEALEEAGKGAEESAEESVGLVD